MGGIKTMKPDNKCERRKIVKSEEVRLYQYGQAHKYEMVKRLNDLGYRSPEEYIDGVSQYAW